MTEHAEIFISATTADLGSYRGEVKNALLTLVAPLNNLAELLRETGRLTEAELLLRRALTIDEKAFGPEHPKRGSAPRSPGRAARAQ